jgi:hypothetical protein
MVEEKLMGKNTNLDSTDTNITNTIPSVISLMMGL